MISIGVMAGCLALGGACGDGRTQPAAAHQAEPRPVCRVERVTRRLGPDTGVVKKGPVEAGVFWGGTARAYGSVTRRGPSMGGVRKRGLKFGARLQSKWGAPATFRVVNVDTGRPAYWTFSRGDEHLEGYSFRVKKTYGKEAGVGAGVLVPGAGCYRLETRTAGKVLNLYFEVPDEPMPLPSGYSPPDG